MINLIVAFDKNRVIGKGNSLPWHFSEDLKLFKRITTGNIILMGRKTYQSIGRPLPNRKNVVISQNKDFKVAEGIELYSSLEEPLNKYRDENLFIIGGATIYEQTLNLVDRLHISHIKGEYSGDTFFPKISYENWEICLEEDYKDFTYRVYKRKS